ncbi:unnamed protein product [Mytilus edulis]|uniref:Uncharacterized protein n=1 Tax=Mytilus edulis TaxID=6550 RepID=A0A8S3TDF8_MYTED|nr:unnamed protein product [Mytilus edulis]
MEPEPDQELISVTSPDLPINDHLEHLEPVVPRVRLFPVMVPKPTIIQIADVGRNSGVSGEVECLQLIFQCEDIRGHPDEQKSPTSCARIYADIQMSRSLRRVGMICRYVVPRLAHYGIEPEPEPIPVTSHEMTINYHLQHFEAVVPRCEDIRGHPDEQKSPTSWYDMPLCGSTHGAQLPPMKMTINDHLEHFEAVVPRVYVMKESGEVECLHLIFQCEDIRGHPDKLESPTAGMICRFVFPRLEALQGVARTNPSNLP